MIDYCCYSIYYFYHRELKYTILSNHTGDFFSFNECLQSVKYSDKEQNYKIERRKIRSRRSRWLSTCQHRVCRFPVRCFVSVWFVIKRFSGSCNKLAFIITSIIGTAVRHRDFKFDIIEFDFELTATSEVWFLLYDFGGTLTALEKNAVGV